MFRVPLQDQLLRAIYFPAACFLLLQHHMFVYAYAVVGLGAVLQSFIVVVLKFGSWSLVSHREDQHLATFV
jgi:hypothetical protein